MGRSYHPVPRTLPSFVCDSKGLVYDSNGYVSLNRPRWGYPGCKKCRCSECGGRGLCRAPRKIMGRLSCHTCQEIERSTKNE